MSSEARRVAGLGDKSKKPRKQLASQKNLMHPSFRIDSKRVGTYMNPQVTLKYSWPELEIRETEIPVPTERPIPRLGFEKKLRNAFFGKYSKFLTYLPYLGTDFTGGFGLHTFQETTSSRKTFVTPKPDPGPIFVEEEWREEWEYYLEATKITKSSSEFELWGFFFLYSGDKENFQIWLEIQEDSRAISTSLKFFLSLLGWRHYEPKRDESLLSLLFAYQTGESKKGDLDLIAKSILYEGNWQFSGILLDAISKGIWYGERANSFWRFIVGFYEDWKDWEKTRIRALSLGKLPPTLAVSLFEDVLSADEKQEYLEGLNLVFRGKTKSDTSSLNEKIQMFLKNFKLQNDYERDLLLRKLKQYPCSYYYNLLNSFVAAEDANWSLFHEAYERAGRLRFLPIALHFKAKYLQNKGDTELANTLFKVAEDHDGGVE